MALALVHHLAIGNNLPLGHIADYLREELDSPAFEVPQLMRDMVKGGKLGKKSGEGFYAWEKGKPKKDKDAAEGINLKSLAEELMQPYFDECRACLADGIVDGADAVDAGMVFGTGFAPFRGGPMFYLDNRGEQES